MAMMENYFEGLFVTRYKSVQGESNLENKLNILTSLSALVSLGNHDFTKSFIEYALAEKINMEEIQETILQTYLFAGFPAAIEGFIVLKTIQQEQFNPLNRKAENDINLWRDRGRSLCERVYSVNYNKMMQNIQTLNPDLADWMLYEGYGKVLSRSGLSGITRELCAVASLAVLGWERQLFSHCKGAVNLGAKKEDVNSVLMVSELFKRGTYEKFKYIIDQI